MSVSSGGPRLGVGATLGLAILCVSSAAVLTKLCESGPFSVAFWRLALVSALLWGSALARPAARSQTWAAFRTPWAAGAGLFLAAHFVLWIASLDHTTVAASCFLLAVHVPVAGLVSWLLLKEPPTRLALIGMVITLSGVTLLSAAALRSEGGWEGSALGNLLAIGGGIAYVGYVSIGRRVRERVSIFRYLAAVYGWAALGVAATALAFGQSLGVAREQDWWPLVALALLATLGGHGLFNYVLAHVRVYVVNLAVMGEFVAAAVLAWVVLGEVPGAAFWPSAPLILGGAVLAVLETRRLATPGARREAIGHPDVTRRTRP